MLILCKEMSTIITNFFLLFLNISVSLVSCVSFQTEPLEQLPSEQLPLELLPSEPLEQLPSIRPNSKAKDHLFHLLPQKDHDDAKLFMEIVAEEEVTQVVYRFAPGFEDIKLVKLKPIDHVMFARKDNNFYWRTKHDWGWVALTLGMIALVLFVTLYAWNYQLLKPFVIPKEPTDERSWLSKIL